MEYVNKFKLKESWIELGIRKLTKHTGENYYLQGEQNILQEMKNDHSWVGRSVLKAHILVII